MPVILTLDLATATGWCVGTPGGQPRHDTVRLTGATHGAKYAAFLAWLEDAQRVHRPTVIVYEAPLNKGSHHGQAAAMLAFGLIAMTELHAYDNAVQVFREWPQETRKAVMGRGTFPKGTAKAEVGKWLAAQGYAPRDDNAADALMLWLKAAQMPQFRGGGA